MRPRIFIFIFLLQAAFDLQSQIAHYNQFPTIQPAHILDQKLDNISFAYSLRVLESDYNGPLIRLRRASDNTEMDFTYADNDKIDITAIDNWRAGAAVFITIWYDQSGMGRDAFQTSNNLQPRFFPDATQPYFSGDGVDDLLIIPESIQNLTQNGKNGSVMGVFLATNSANNSFGVINGSNNRDRWLVHINWNNKNCYFDPGYCCNNPRSFFNHFPNHPTQGSLGVWDQYSFIRRDDSTIPIIDRIIMRIATVEKVNGDFPDGRSCTVNFNMGIGAAINTSTNGASNYGDTYFTEMIMYQTGLSDTSLLEIEQNQIAFWNL